MKFKLLSATASILFLFVLTSNLCAQFNQPTLQIGIGITQPMGDMQGTYYDNVIVGNASLMAINKDFMTNNYGAKTGLFFFGKGKINFDKYSITRGILFAGFNTFNTFEPSKNGNIGVRVLNINNTYDTILSSASFNYSFNNFQLGLGLEIAPTSFTNKISPYFGAAIAFNSFSGKISRTENRVDSVGFSFSEFRIGFTFDAGIEYQINKMIGLSLGAKYDLGNVLMKRTDGGIADRSEWGKTNASINDAAGTFYSSIYSPVLSSDVQQYQAKQKNIFWGSIYLAVNIHLGQSKTTTPPKKK